MAADDGDLFNRQVVDHYNNTFTMFKRKFGKSYATQEEHDYRFRVFKANMNRARRYQKMDPTAVHGVTQFSDLTSSEFRTQFLGLNRLGPFPTKDHRAPILLTNNLPTHFDWRDHGAVTPVKNQGSCGSSWSFSTAGALEGANFLATGKLVSLSEQQLVDCDHECDRDGSGFCDSGCSGGLMFSAFEYAIKSGGLMREEDYPYTGTDGGTCKLDRSKIAADVANFSVVPLGEDQIAANLVHNGPLAVAINPVFAQTYVKGISCPHICSRALDQGALLVGYGQIPFQMKEKLYWIIKNSWGESWGENGYMRICHGYHNICGTQSIVTRVAAVTTLSSPHHQMCWAAAEAHDCAA
ncbi:probable cysteine proteinase a494 [Phtheirospermum japonicum]|uniref:Probable cysteine proteinase a494 n=1 Tax=Phtheirospermum japonicum TaxID=374723 RepID=A0A830D7K3_9LAMI|nr:probable cysteine proteinase a494 [Phtheirospermum japonicum]